MGFFDKVRDKLDEAADSTKESLEAAVTGPIRGTEALLDGDFEGALEGFTDAVTFGQGEEVLEANETILTGGLNKVKEKQDREKAKEAAEIAKLEAEKATIQEKQEKLRQLEFDKAIGEQTEAEQLAQRTLFRQAQQINRESTNNLVEAQRARANASNIAAQTGIRNSSSFQGTLSSISTETASTQGVLNTTMQDVEQDQARLASNLDSNLEFLGETFALGGDINAASQRLANQQAAIEDRARQRANTLQGAGTAATLASLAGGGPAVVIGSAILGGMTGGDYSFEDIFSF